MDVRTNNRRRVVAAFAVLEDGDVAGELTKFMSEDDSDVCSSLIEHYSKKANREPALNRIVKQMLSSERFSSLADVHPAWIVEKLKDETPRVIGIVLRFLPSQHVRYILKNLPPILCEQVPNMVESFSVKPDILDVIRRKFEKHFLPMRVSRTVEGLGFENLYYLKQGELEELFKDMGLMEMAVAFSTMSSQALRIIYNRMSIRDAKRLKMRIGNLSNISPGMYRQAQNTLLMIESERVGPQRLLKTIGLAAFANAIGEGHEDLVRMIMQKLDPRDGYILKRYVDEGRMRLGLLTVDERQNIVLDIAALLAREGRIDEAWNGFSPSEDSQTAVNIRPLEQVVDEETHTARQLA